MNLIAGAALILAMLVAIRRGYLIRAMEWAAGARPGEVNAGRSARRTLVVALACSAVLLGHRAFIQLRDGSYMAGDAVQYALIARSLLEDGDLDLHGRLPGPYATPWNQGGTLIDFHAVVSAGARGEWYPKNTWFYSAVLVPVYALGGPLGMVAANALMGLLLVPAGIALARGFASPAAAAVAVVLLIGLTTLAQLSINIGVDVPSALLVTVSAALLVHGARPAEAREAAPAPPSGERGGNLGWWRGFAAGVAIGSAVLTVSRNVFFLPFLAGLAWQRGGTRAAVAYGLGAAPPILVMLASNWWMFGHPLVTSHDRIMVLTGGIPGIASPRDHVRLAHLPRGCLEIARQTVEYAPAAAAALLGWPALYRRARAEALWLGGAVTAATLFVASFDYAEPSRLLAPVFALLVAPLACLIDRSNGVNSSMRVSASGAVTTTRLE